MDYALIKTITLVTFSVSLAVACSASETDMPVRTEQESDFAASKECSTFTESGPDVEAIRDAEQAGAQTNVKGDTLENAREFFAPEFWNVLPNGEVWDGAEKTLAMYQNGRMVPWARSFELHDLRIRVYCGQVGISTGVGKGVPINTGASEEPVYYRFLHVWIRRDGEWRYTAQQFVRFEP